MERRSFLEEIIDAAKGLFFLLRGKKDQLGLFDFSLFGLVGSFIGVILGFALQSIFSGPAPQELPVPAWAVIITYVLLYATPFLAAWGFLAIINGRDRLLPYMVVNNWGSFFFSILLMIVYTFNIVASVGMFIIVLLVLLLFWRTSRVILEFSIPQTIIFFVANVMAILIAAVVASNIIFASAGVDPVEYLEQQQRLMEQMQDNQL